MKVFYYRRNHYGETPHVIEKEKINFNELTFVLKGSLEYFIDGKKVVVKENGCIFLKEGSIRERKQIETCDYASFNFTGAEVDFPISLQDVVDAEVNILISLCDQIHKKYIDWADKISTALTLIVNIIEEKLFSQEENPLIIKIKRIINENLSNKLTLSSISKAIGYSPNYCDSLFKKHTGVAILDYAIERRIEKAKLLLQEGILSLSEISSTVGFEDYNYFCRTFKKRTKLTPTEYKNVLKTK